MILQTPKRKWVQGVQGSRFKGFKGSSSRFKGVCNPLLWRRRHRGGGLQIRNCKSDILHQKSYLQSLDLLYRSNVIEGTCGLLRQYVAGGVYDQETIALVQCVTDRRSVVQGPQSSNKKGITGRKPAIPVIFSNL